MYHVPVSNPTVYMSTALSGAEDIRGLSLPDSATRVDSTDSTKTGKHTVTQRTMSVSRS